MNIMDNKMGEEKAQVEERPKEVKLTEVSITDEVVALNILVSFLNLAQRRGVFNIEESSKIWECIRKFQRE
jgi:hypothetical protein